MAVSDSKPYSIRLRDEQVEGLKIITRRMNSAYNEKLGKVWQTMTWHDMIRLMLDNSIEEVKMLDKLPRVSKLKKEGEGEEADEAGDGADDG